MPRLLVHVEGQTEEMFVNEMLREHLLRMGYSKVSARILGNPRQRSRRGGIRPWDSAKRDILRHLSEDMGAIATTMVDYYAMPQTWPGRSEAQGEQTAQQKAARVESALLVDISASMGPRLDQRRFVPMVTMHEFEALLFSDPEQFAREIGRPELGPDFAAIRRQFETPEDINDSEITAPSKRIERLFPGYEKPLFGALAALEIGLATMRRECPHFNDWLNRLEALPGQL